MLVEDDVDPAFEDAGDGQRQVVRTVGIMVAGAAAVAEALGRVAVLVAAVPAAEENHDGDRDGDGCIAGSGEAFAVEPAAFEVAAEPPVHPRQLGDALLEPAVAGATDESVGGWGAVVVVVGGEVAASDEALVVL